MKLNKYQKYLETKNLSDSTITAYLSSIKLYFERYKLINEKNINLWKLYQLETYKTKTVNLRIRAINSFCEYSNLNLKLTFIKEQKKTFLENVISNADYQFLCTSLKSDNNLFWYFIVRFLTCTGARVSELIKFKIEHLQVGYIDIYSKGGKSRRIYIPKKLQKESLLFYKGESGYLFQINNNLIHLGSIRKAFKRFALKYRIKKEVMHPHSFRHLFAKNFISKYKDIALLADLLGHSSIETTRIYLKRTSEEQKAIVDKIVDW